jgi:16S rRNA (adenine1518-N6/adenine1519-N6)-dimethyltransferase
VPLSPLASTHATREVLDRHGLSARKRLGQHFLVDDNIVGRIIALSELREDDIVLEVGPGIGTLTLALCDAAEAVIAVEADERMAGVLKDTTGACPELTLVIADAMKLSPAQISTEEGIAPSAFVANLPYSVAATLVLRFLEEIETLRSATVMVQAEVADRMSAEPGTKAYGAYTVKLALRAEIRGRFGVPRTCFLPQPRVDSAVVHLVPVAAPADPGVVDAAARIADAAFCQRRKTLRNSLSAGLGVEPSVAEKLLLDCDIDPGRRAETLHAGDFLALAANALENSVLP